jgi:hypothetical protein
MGFRLQRRLKAALKVIDILTFIEEGGHDRNSFRQIAHEPPAPPVAAEL